MSASEATYVALSGGVGGAKLSLGLARLFGPRLSVIVNTGDDFEHLGLYISPDVDTALYTLAGLVNEETGWGRRDETWAFMTALERLGGPTWFKLGDGDLATHVWRTARLRSGASPSGICAEMATALGVAARVLPMADEKVRTLLDTGRGTLAFQEYFVRDRCRPAVRRIRFEGADTARPTLEALQALAAPTLAGIAVCPSNPYLSIDPILAVPGLREALKASAAPVVAVSPLIGGRAVKGPAAKIMAELGLRPDSVSIARHYTGLIDGLVIDEEDAALAGRIALPTLVTNTLMRTPEDKIALAAQCVGFCERLAAGEVGERRCASR